MSSDQLFFQRHIFICTYRSGKKNSCSGCGCHKSDDLRKYMKKQCKKSGLKSLRVNSAGCLNRCGCGPVMVIYPEGVWYSFSSEKDIDEIIQSHLVDNAVVDRLKLSPKDKKPKN